MILKREELFNLITACELQRDSKLNDLKVRMVSFLREWRIHKQKYFLLNELEYELIMDLLKVTKNKYNCTSRYNMIGVYMKEWYLIRNWPQYKYMIKLIEKRSPDSIWRGDERFIRLRWDLGGDMFSIKISSDNELNFSITGYIRKNRKDTTLEELNENDILNILDVYNETYCKNLYKHNEFETWDKFISLVLQNHVIDDKGEFLIEWVGLSNNEYNRYISKKAFEFIGKCYHEFIKEYIDSFEQSELDIMKQTMGV